MIFEGGGSRCAGLLDYKWKEAASEGYPAAQSCLIEQNWRRLLLGRGSRCAGLLECWIANGRRLLLKGIPLLRAA